MKKFVVLFSISIFISSCATRRSEWIKGFPAEKGYYIGIGTSNTGNESRDRKIAEDRARTNIAASISTKLHSETKIFSRDNSEGEYYNYVEEEVTAVVEQSLSGIETVDTYYSKSTGAWIFMKLSIERWKKNQIEEMAALISRVKEFLTPVLNDFDRPLVTRLQELLKARNLILESPYSGMLKTTNLYFKIGLVDSPYILFDILIIDLPKFFENSIDIAQANVVISLIKEEKTIFSFESDKFKNGDATPEQAHLRAVEKMIKNLETNKEYVTGIV